MKLLFANRKDTNIKYWMRHKNKTDFFSLHANFRLVNKMVFLFNSPFIYMYIYKHIYIKELFIMLMWIVFTTHKNERRSLFVNKYIGCFFKYSIHLNVVAFLFFSRSHSILNGLNMCSCICAHSCFRFNFIHMKNSILIIVMRQWYILLVTLYYSFCFVW